MVIAKMSESNNNLDVENSESYYRSSIRYINSNMTLMKISILTKLGNRLYEIYSR